jgi:hypothetical protein
VSWKADYILNDFEFSNADILFTDVDDTLTTAGGNRQPVFGAGFC